MSDPGFPPFRSAPPKGQAKPQAGSGSLSGGIAGQGLRPNEPVRHEELEKILNSEDDRPVQVNPDGSLSEQAQHITVCAKCGSREVREAVLIGDEVYVKL